MRTAMSLLAVLVLFSETASSERPTSQVSRSDSMEGTAVEQVAPRGFSLRDSSQLDAEQNRLQANGS